MAHNLNQGRMAYVGEKPWHRLGKAVPPTVSAAEMISAAGLDWEVVKRPARGASLVWARKPSLLKPGADIKPEDEVEYSRYELVRPPYAGHDEETVLGIVSARYEPLQNREAFKFFEPIVDQKRAFFETAGALGDGERVWVMARMPEMMEVVPGDTCQKYLLLSNTHNGKGSVIVKFTAVRVVCQNTLMMSLEDGQAAYKVRHSKAMSGRLTEVGDLIAAAQKVYAAAMELFKVMARYQLNARLFNEYLELVYPRHELQVVQDKVPERWTRISELFDSHGDLQLPGVRGSLWAAYNAVTYFEDHKEVKRESAEGRLERVWFGGGADVKLKALAKARELVSSN